MRRARWIAAALVAALAPAARASPALRPVVASHGSYGETFTFVADLEDSTYVQVSMGLTSIGPGGIKTVCRAVVAAPAGATWRASERSGSHGWTWAETDTGERLTVGPCSAAVVGETTELDVPLEGGALRLAIAGRATRRDVPDAALALGDGAYRSDILLYRVPVTGTVALPGAPGRALVGAAYADHSRSTVRPRDLADRWVRFRALRGDRGLVLLARRGHDGRFTPAWACDPPGRCRLLGPFTLERAGQGAATSFRVGFPEDDPPVEIRSLRLLYRDAPVEELGVLGKVVAPFVGSPVTYRYRARLSDGPGEPLEGILEIELSGE